MFCTDLRLELQLFTARMWCKSWLRMNYSSSITSVQVSAPSQDQDPDILCLFESGFLASGEPAPLQTDYCWCPLPPSAPQLQCCGSHNDVYLGEIWNMGGRTLFPWKKIMVLSSKYDKNNDILASKLVINHFSTWSKSNIFSGHLSVCLVSVDQWEPGPGSSGPIRDWLVWSWTPSARLLTRYAGGVFTQHLWLLHHCINIIQTSKLSTNK